MNHRKLTIGILSLAISASAGVKYTINDNWQFYGNPLPYQAVRVDLPHTWNAGDAADDAEGYFRGQGKYRKTLILPESIFGKRVFLNFEGANQTVKLRVNGSDVNKGHVGGYTAFAVDVTPYVKAGDNDIEIYVDNSHNADIPPLMADFTFYGGIYRDLYLEIENPVHISHSDFGSDGIYVDVQDPSEKKVRVNVTTLLDNFEPRNVQVRIEQSLYDDSGALVGHSSRSVKLPGNSTKNKVLTRFNMLKPRLWSPDQPSLYRIETKVIKKSTDETADAQDTQFGVRWYSFDPDNGFMLNGKPLKLIGTNRHQDYMGKGWAIGDERHKRDVELLKSMGGNFLRVSHYPQDQALMEACDRLGIITMVEIPIVDYVTESDDFLTNCLNMQAEMIKQNYNHPSIVIWAYMNEVMLVPPYKHDDPKYKPYCEELHRQAVKIDSLSHALDPQRYTLIPMNNAMQPYYDADLYDVPQLIGWNVYQGWYSGDFADMDKFIDEFHVKHPSKPTIITEYGADCDTRLHADAPRRFDYTVEYADMFHEHYHRALTERPYIAGMAIWNLNDFSSESRGFAKPHLNVKGIVTQDRMPKNTYWLYKANHSKEPFVRFASQDWTRRSAQLDADGNYTTEMKIYTNRNKVDLNVNGKQRMTLPVTGGVATTKVLLRDGKNRLVAVTDSATTTMDITLQGIPYQLDNDFDELSVSLGSWTTFTNPATDICWIPEQEYRKGSWGYVGGETVLDTNWASSDIPFEANVLCTDEDPLYQTLRRGLEKMQFDVPDGRYALYLHWADMPKDADNCFDVMVNGQTVIPALDVKKQVGPRCAYVVRIDADAHDGKGVEVAFRPIRGQAFLNALRLVRR